MHEDFLYHLNNTKFNNLKRCIVVIDGELVLENTVSKVFKQRSIANCWNHILQDVERWVKNHGRKMDDCIIYKTHVRKLLDCKTEEQFLLKVTTLKPSWSAAFVQYFDNFLAKRIKKAGQWYLLSVGITTEGITTNMSESLKASLKRFQDWKEVTPDMMTYSLFQIQSVVLSEIESSLNGFGPYRPTMSNIPIKQSEQKQPQNYAVTIDSVRQRLKGDRTELVPRIVQALADVFSVTYTPAKAAFFVSRKDGPIHAIKVIPKESCSCPAVTTCCHIIAAKKSIGLDTGERKKLNLSELQKRKR